MIFYVYTVVVFYFFRRNYVRDCLRLLVSSVPSLALWLVNHTVQSIGALSQQVLTIAGANQSGHIGTIDWPMTEALLHALTAITKHIHRLRSFCFTFIVLFSLSVHAT